MKGARLDGSTPSCSFSTEEKNNRNCCRSKNILGMNSNSDAYLKAQVTANDKTGNC